MTARRWLLLGVALLFAASALAGATVAAFTSTTSNTGNAFSSAATFPPSCAAPSTVTALATADTWVDQGSPTNAFGTDTVLKTKSGSGNSNARSLFRFTMPAVPAGCTVTLATLRLYAASSSSGRTLEARRITAAWPEATVNWNTQPATSATNVVTTTSGAGYRQWTATQLVLDIYANTNNGVLIRDATENSAASPEQQWHARDKGSEPPQLVITFG